MADVEPTYVDIKDMGGTGMSQRDIHRAIYNLEQAIYAICNNIDEDVGNTGIDYLTKIGTDLRAAMVLLRTPPGGPVT